jgi:glycosyltransferase involved in cell wall biosynthesis
MLLSIIIPSYNHEQFILSTLKAATEIGIPDKEIIVIDDGSTDSSTHVISEYIASQGRGINIRLVTRENRGLVKTLNEGLSLSQGEYFYLVASDDIPIPDGVTHLVNILQNNRALQFVLGNAQFIGPGHQVESIPVYGEAQRAFFALPCETRQKEMFMNYPNPLLLQATVFRKSALDAIGGWREDIVSDDFSLFLRMFSMLENPGHDFEYLPEIMVCFYRMHQTNTFRNFQRQFMTVEQAIVELCPRKWWHEAVFRNFATYGLGALRKGEISMFIKFFRRTLMRLGVVRCFLIFPARAVIRRLAH